MADPYYDDGTVALWLGDCREIDAWLAADVLVTDPPYGRNWKQGRAKRHGSDAHPGIAGDKDTTVRDQALAMWGDRLAIAFGDPMIPPPAGTKQVCGYLKAVDAGTKGTFGGFRRDLEVIYLLGPWPAGLNGRSSVLASGARNQGNPSGTSARYGHPHAKPVDVMETLVGVCPPGVIADPFAGSGSTLVAARNLGRRAIGIEAHEPYIERAARRLAQAPLEVS